MADTSKEAPKTRQQRLTAQYLFRRKVYGPPEGKQAAMVEVPADFPTEDELKARAEKSQLSTLGGPSQPLSVSARSAKAAMLEEGEPTDEYGEDEDEDEQPVAVDARGEPLFAEDSEGDGSLDEAMAESSDGGTPRKAGGRAKRAAKKAGKKK